MRKYAKWIAALLFAFSVLTNVVVAEAHVTVWPKQSTAGTWEKYTVRVPVEKNVNTTKVRVEFPKGVEVHSVMPVPGWEYEFEKGKDGKTTALSWKATNGGIKPNEFAEFSFVAENPKQAGAIAWRAEQSYADGSVVYWTGAPDSDTPASVTSITASARPTNESAQHPASTVTPKTNAASASVSKLNFLSLGLAGLALLLSLISLFRKQQNTNE
ncbi:MULTISPECIES: YcnI family protein [Thermoactinomyces]|jgi:uncharacterized protein YcnI|uniref:YcnI family protein n=1 Tax=Thermoactinomyces daqus TaxID=1329516 RepID=A0A7W2AJH8_9BACL|nr:MULTISPECIES: YcnI family protein [Thermoactinomyces]MBA4544410.1 YcnI family protein [Thermoactinomyces daqus]MBH8598185.1 YcnI family protein [Thermoactinomyces sp. CICC 10523]MBH8603214.1 YcnI family protein [Thermoactinomyces sp. CICC 10522]MBH8608630.1 YcnI family protein [Thermoactinomyces sp. CICC 10521]